MLVFFFFLYFFDEVGIGVADCIVSIMERHGMSKEEARRRFYFVDTKVKCEVKE